MPRGIVCDCIIQESHAFRAVAPHLYRPRDLAPELWRVVERVLSDGEVQRIPQLGTVVSEQSVDTEVGRCARDIRGGLLRDALGGHATQPRRLTAAVNISFDNHVIVSTKRVTTHPAESCRCHRRGGTRCRRR